MSVHSSPKRLKKCGGRIKFRSLGNHDEFLERITKTLYYAELPLTERFSLPVSELAAGIFSEVKAGKTLERLRLEDAAEMSRNACVSPCSLVLAMLYLDQLKGVNPDYVDRVAPSELFVISLMIAAKFLNDSGEEDDVLNSEWAVSCGFSLKEINQLEKDFLKAINWEVYVKESSFWLALRGLEKTVALKEGTKRGWFSYTDLELLLDTVQGLALAQTVFTVSAVCLASYTAGMLTVIGSTLLATQLSAQTSFNAFTTVLPPLGLDHRLNDSPNCTSPDPSFLPFFEDDPRNSSEDDFQPPLISTYLDGALDHERNLMELLTEYIGAFPNRLKYFPLQEVLTH